MGIDSEDPFVKKKLYGSGGQADVIILAVINRDNKKVSFVSVSRDVMTDIETYDVYGNHISTVKKQLALQFAYGDGYKESCRMTAEAVSNLFFGIPIHGYCAMSMGAVAPLNDTVGGAEVTLKSDFTEISPDMKKGETVLLLGDVAYRYLRTRPEETNAERLDRQTDYLSALSVKLREKIKSNVMFVASVYSSVKDYVLTNLSLGEMLYLSSEAVNMDFSDKMYTLEGEYVTEGEHAEFYADKWAMFRLILSLYFNKVG
jgi:LCP family protein required for cell wall assembly